MVAAGKEAWIQRGRRRERDRGEFFKNSTVALTSLISAEAARAMAEQESPPSAGATGSIGRPVRAVSSGIRPGPSLEQIAGQVDKEGASGWQFF